MEKQKVAIHRLGLIEYQEGWDLQYKLLDTLVASKRRNRERSEDDREVPLHHLVFCEHPPVYTLGKSGKEDHLLLSATELKNRGVDFHKINRGGDITFHGPGQIVGYPIFDLEYFFTDVHKYVRSIEEVIIRTLQHYSLPGERVDGYTGVWLRSNQFQGMRKICAIGVHLSRWVTMHGFALNANTDLSHFEKIIPCGIQDKDKEVTSLKRELGNKVDLELLQDRLVQQFVAVFGFQPVGSKGMLS